MRSSLPSKVRRRALAEVAHACEAMDYHFSRVYVACLRGARRIHVLDSPAARSRLYKTIDNTDDSLGKWYRAVPIRYTGTFD